MRSLSRVTRYAEWLADERIPAPATDPDQLEETRTRAAAVLDRATAGGTWVPPDEAGSLLADYGLAVLGEVVTGPAAAAQVAQRLGFPVAVKLDEADVVHKTERRLVRVGLGSADDVRRVVGEFEAELEGPARVLVQPMASGIEGALGVVRDPRPRPDRHGRRRRDRHRRLGRPGLPAAADLADRRYARDPRAAALAAARRLPRRAARRRRGARAAGRRLGRLAVDIPEVAELDLNPVLVGPDGCAVVDVKLRVSSSDDPGPAAPRQLRRVR